MVTRFRSLIAALGIKNNQNPSIFIKCSSEDSFKAFSTASEVMSALVRSGDAKVLKSSDPDPAGCLQAYINEELKIFLQVVGVIEVKSAFEQMQTNAKTLQDRLDKAIAKTKMKNYEQKVPADVREEARKKIKQLETELAENQSSMEGLQKLM